MTGTLPGPLVTGDWLASNLENVAVADVRWAIDTGPKLADYLQGHIPGAAFVDLDRDLSDRPGPQGRHPLPTVASFRAMLSMKGLVNRPVVCYDDVGGGVAARLWWMLDVLGFPAAVLDGGLNAWSAELGSGDETPALAQRLDPALADEAWPPEAVVGIGELTDIVTHETSTIVDARSAARFDGHPNPIDNPAGHMPGARSRPWQQNVTEQMRMRPSLDLHQEFADAGLIDGSWIATCGSGVTACHNLLAARVAGVGGGRLYAGSWSEWSQDPERPVATNWDQD